MGSTLKGKNLLLEEQILSFKNQHTNEKGVGGGDMNSCLLLWMR